MVSSRWFSLSQAGSIQWSNRLVYYHKGMKDFPILNEFVSTQKKLSISVIGDCMVDEYYYVQVNRLSPEFPIPVWLSPSEDMKYALPGGAANVVYQFRHFNHDVTLVSFINDYACSIFNQCGVKQAGWYGECQVPIKRRLYHGEFPLCRWDIEQQGYNIKDQSAWYSLPNIAASKGCNFLLNDVIIFSDYNKGIFDRPWFTSLFKDYTGTTIVDPKNDIDKWRGCTILKPNSVEAKKLSGKNRWQDQARYLKDRVQCQSVVITQGGDGVVGLFGDKEFEYKPRHKSDVVSLQGAGDCFIAFLAMAIGNHYDVPQAAQIAFEAGCAYVENRHNEPIKPHQLLQRENPIHAKYVRPEQLKDRSYKLVFTNGCFDILHQGHVETLEFAKSKGDKLVVAVNSDASVRRLKGESRPINSQHARMRVLASMSAVDFITMFEEDTPLEAIKKCSPDVVVKGGEYKPEDVVGYGLAEVILAPMYEGVSTSSICKRIISTDS